MLAYLIFNTYTKTCFFINVKETFGLTDYHLHKFNKHSCYEVLKLYNKKHTEVPPSLVSSMVKCFISEQAYQWALFKQTCLVGSHKEHNKVLGMSGIPQHEYSKELLAGAKLSVFGKVYSKILSFGMSVAKLSLCTNVSKCSAPMCSLLKSAALT